MKDWTRNSRSTHATLECFHCRHRTVVWDNDFTFEDFGYDGDGIVHILHCANCGADIEYDIPINDQESEEEVNERGNKENENN